MLIKQFPDADVIKGKMAANPDLGFKRAGTRVDGRQKVRKKWVRLVMGETKLNTDGAFTSNGAATRMVLRDHNGEVIFAACRELHQCNDPTEAEIAAIEEGIRLALQWTTLKFTVESDCAEDVELIRETTPNTSAYEFRINVIRELLRKRDVKIVKICREANTVSHELAKLGRTQGRTDFWLSSVP